MAGRAEGMLLGGGGASGDCRNLERASRDQRAVRLEIRDSRGAGKLHGSASASLGMKIRTLMLDGEVIKHQCSALYTDPFLPN